MVQNKWQGKGAIPPTSSESVSDFQIVEFTHTSNGFKLKHPIRVELPAQMNRETRDIYNYLVRSLVGTYPKLVSFACRNSAVVELARYLRRWTTSSTSTLRNYVYGTAQFCRWCEREPDELIRECKTNSDLPAIGELSKHVVLLEDFIGSLRADGLAPGTVALYAKGVKALYQANGLKLELSHRLKRTPKYEDRAPTPEELQRLLDLGDLRTKVIVSCLALGGFREGSLARLEYHHIREDLERGVVPIHIHVEAEITKGKYHSYDTFLGKEAADYLKAYLDERRRGTLRVYRTPNGHLAQAGIPPEQIDDESPLIKAERSKRVRPLSTKQIYETIHSLYRRAGLIPTRISARRYYKLRAHSIRKFFRTQLAALGVDRDYIEYMMGHTISTYHDIQMKGVEFLRNVYAASGLSIRTKTRLSRIEALKEIIRAWGMEPERILTREALSEPHRVVVDGESRQIEVLQDALKKVMRKELLSTTSEG